MESGGTTIELLGADQESTDRAIPGSAGEGLHHVAFHVPDLEARPARAEAAGPRADRPDAHGRKPRGMKIAFLHPRSMGGVLIELCERRKP